MASHQTTVGTEDNELRSVQNCQEASNEECQNVMEIQEMHVRKPKVSQSNFFLNKPFNFSSPTDSILSPCTKMLQAKKAKNCEGAKPRILSGIFAKVLREEQKKKAQEKSKNGNVHGKKKDETMYYIIPSSFIFMLWTRNKIRAGSQGFFGGNGNLSKQPFITGKFSPTRGQTDIYYL
ncbi:23020_t:CDS:2 [Dentiscutata erythropus]|uniref:23020_t:CDS:1 n=1 Tax=Dentiscutata erythropus TaxID=1348616 RepID=A0A9N8ZJN7_9GLOM|nr:23020_t:CDS:2 [Dentiscutata erythropus]